MAGGDHAAVPAGTHLDGSGHLRRPAGRPGDAHDQGAHRGAEPGHGAQAGHVRGRAAATATSARPLFVPESAVLTTGETAGSSSSTAATAVSSRARFRLGDRVEGGYAVLVRPRRRRPRRHLGQLPDRLRVEPQGGALGTEHARSAEAFASRCPGPREVASPERGGEGGVDLPHGHGRRLRQARLVPEVRHGPRRPAGAGETRRGAARAPRLRDHA